MHWYIDFLIVWNAGAILTTCLCKWQWQRRGIGDGWLEASFIAYPTWPLSIWLCIGLLTASFRKTEKGS